MKLFEDHAFLIFLAFVCVIAVYAVIVVVGRAVDERIIGTIGVGLAGGLLGLAKNSS